MKTYDELVLLLKQGVADTGTAINTAANINATKVKDSAEKAIKELIAERDEAAYELEATENEMVMVGQKLREVTKQRDELVEALEKLTNVFANIGITSGIYEDEQAALEQACAALTSVKESK